MNPVPDIRIKRPLTPGSRISAHGLSYSLGRMPLGSIRKHKSTPCVEASNGIWSVICVQWSRTPVFETLNHNPVNPIPANL